MRLLISQPPEPEFIPHVWIPSHVFGGTKHARGQCNPKSEAKGYENVTVTLWGSTKQAHTSAIASLQFWNPKWSLSWSFISSERSDELRVVPSAKNNSHQIIITNEAADGMDQQIF